MSLKRNEGKKVDNTAESSVLKEFGNSGAITCSKRIRSRPDGKKRDAPGEPPQSSGGGERSSMKPSIFVIVWVAFVKDLFLKDLI